MNRGEASRLRPSAFLVQDDPELEAIRLRHPLGIIFRPEVAFVVVRFARRGPLNRWDDPVTTFEIEEIVGDDPIPPQRGVSSVGAFEDRERGRFSVAAGLFGWASAAFFSLALLGIVLALVGNAAYDSTANTDPRGSISQAALDNLASAGIVAGILVIFVSYVLGGYNAGRIDRTHGIGQGIVIVGWTLAFGAGFWVLANATGSVANAINDFAPLGITWTGISARSIAVLIITVFVMLGGATLGGYVAAPSEEVAA